MQKIYIIIVNYHSEDVIGAAVKSFDEENIETQIVILDNDSTEESFEALQKVVGDDIEIIRSETNLGYSAGANSVARHIQERYSDAEYFFFFNPDAEASKNMLGTLYKSLEENPSAAAVSPLILDMKKEKWFSGTSIEWKNCTINNNPTVDNPDEIREIDTFNGCAVLMHAKLYFDAGMFNEDLFIYYDEPFLSMEFLKQGYTSLYNPKALAYHHVSHTISSIFESRLMTRNHIYFFKKYGKSKMFLCPYLRPLHMMAYFLKHFKFDNAKHVALGIMDSLQNKKGL